MQDIEIPVSKKREETISFIEMSEQEKAKLIERLDMVDVSIQGAKNDLKKLDKINAVLNDTPYDDGLVAIVPNVSPQNMRAKMPGDYGLKSSPPLVGEQTYGRYKNER